eukprot:5022325-Pleurochrysis_carterae.AAC.4
MARPLARVCTRARAFVSSRARARACTCTWRQVRLRVSLRAPELACAPPRSAVVQFPSNLCSSRHPFSPLAGIVSYAAMDACTATSGCARCRGQERQGASCGARQSV